MIVTFNKDGFNLVTPNNTPVRIKTTQDSFDDILSLFMDLSGKENTKPRRVRFE